VSAPLQAFVFSSYLLNVLLQLANKNRIQNKTKKMLIRPRRSKRHAPPERQLDLNGLDGVISQTVVLIEMWMVSFRSSNSFTKSTQSVHGACAVGGTPHAMFVTFDNCRPRKVRRELIIGCLSHTSLQFLVGLFVCLRAQIEAPLLDT
jgi:hypothetical protein